MGQMEDRGQTWWLEDRTELLNRKKKVGELSGVRDVDLGWLGGPDWRTGLQGFLGNGDSGLGLGVERLVAL